MVRNEDVAAGGAAGDAAREYMWKNKYIDI